MKFNALIAGSVFTLAGLAGIPASATAKESLQDLLARMDKAAAGFQAMTANVNYVTHTAVIDDDTKESATVLMRKVRPNEVQGRIDFLKPDPRTVVFEQRKAQVYLPKAKTLQVFDLGEKGEQLDKFVMIGFGTSGSELARDYSMTVTGAEAIAGRNTIKLELQPKSAEVRNIVTKLELWIPETGDPYPVQEKIYEKSPGDFRLVNYTALKINPSVPADALKLKLPAGVQTTYPGK